MIRIVHSNGKVEELSGTIKARDIMKAHPRHVLRKPSSPAPSAGDGGTVVPKIVIVPPDAELQRGKIYFLMPAPPTPKSEKSHSRLAARKKRREQSERGIISNNINSFRCNNGNAISMADLLVSSDRYLTEILSEKISTQRDGRRGRVAVWRPHLESISELPGDM